MIAETITWVPCSPETMPDADTTVMVELADDTEPVWPGFWSGEAWHSATTGGPFFGHVVAWSDLPRGTAAITTQ